MIFHFLNFCYFYYISAEKNQQQLNIQNQPIITTTSSSSIRYNKKSRSTDVSSERLFKELKGADKRIDDLNNMIDTLENEKDTLNTKLSNETALRLSIEANYTDIANKYNEIQLANTDTINKLKELTISIEKEIEEKEKIAVELALWQSKYGNDTDLLDTPTDMRLRKVIKALKDKNKELMDAYEEIGKLEADLQNVAGSSVRRLRRPSFFGKLWGYSWNPLKASMGLFNSHDSKDKNNDIIYTMNRTIHVLHDNLTAMSNVIESKDDIIQELSEQLEEYEEEADKRRDAYVALKEGVAQLQEENDRLEEVLDSRDLEILDIANHLNNTQIELSNEKATSESLKLLLDELKSRFSYQQTIIIKLIYDLELIKQKKDLALFDNEKMNKELLETNDRLQIQNENIMSTEKLSNYTKAATTTINDDTKKGYFL